MLGTGWHGRCGCGRGKFHGSVLAALRAEHRLKLMATEMAQVGAAPESKKYIMTDLIYRLALSALLHTLQQGC